MRRTNGFTLIELLIVVVIIGILAGVVVPKMNNSVRKTRDIRRKGDLHRIQAALSAYFTRNNRYPQALVWYSSEPGDPGYSNNGGDWIPGLAPAFIPKLPRDPKGGASTVCPGLIRHYLYIGDGQTYSLLAHCSPEGPILATDSFYSAQYPLTSWQVCTGDACSW